MSDGERMDSAIRRSALQALEARVVDCRRCPRLVEWRERVAREKRAAFREEEYWGRPVPGFGDPAARLVVIGLAPAAHGANRTGRMFTGDRSGEWLYRALHRAGFANQGSSVGRGDGLELSDAWISAPVRCAPPANKPTTEERRNCAPYLAEELSLLDRAEVYVCLGSVAYQALWGVLRDRGEPLAVPRPSFGHGAVVGLDAERIIVASYHPSQQNTFTGRLTEEMFDDVFATARAHLGS
jgi:uracil-DNA glycosylase family 4